MPPEFFCIKKTTGSVWFQKAFAMTSLAAAASLPLMREVDSPLGEDGGRETSITNSLPQSFALRCVNNRICGSRAEHASERNLDEPIGSASKRPQGG